MLMVLTTLNEDRKEIVMRKDSDMTTGKDYTFRPIVVSYSTLPCVSLNFQVSLRHLQICVNEYTEISFVE